jgi:hypothetical protein
MRDDSTTREEWRPVAGFEGAYEVSSLGRVRSLDRWIDFGNGRGRNAPGRVLRQSWSGRKGNRYCKVALSRGRGQTRTVHVLVAEAWHGPCPRGYWCRHLNGERTDNRPANLAWGTPAENGADTERHGMSTKGERNPMSKLTTDDVREIRRLRADGMLLREVGTLFGIGEAQVCRIAKRVEWSHVE